MRPKITKTRQTDANAIRNLFHDVNKRLVMTNPIQLRILPWLKNQLLTYGGTSISSTASLKSVK